MRRLPPAASVNETPILVTAARIRTMNPASPVAEAMLVVDGRIARIGARDEVAQAAGLLDDGSASPADMDRLSQGIASMVASLASGTR